MINKNTKIYGVIGDPVEHSLSPVLHKFFFKKFDINALYFAFRIEAKRLQNAIDGMRAFGVSGLNVTTPHKENVTSFVDSRSSEVKLMGAANTLKNENDGISAYGTDPAGFIESLGVFGDRFTDAHVVLLGAGGSARAIAFALARLSVGQLTLVNRTLTRARQLATITRETFGIHHIETVMLSDPYLNDAIAEASIVINATTVGMFPNTTAAIINNFAAFSNRHFVYDLIYNPATSLFLSRAREKGATIQNGLDMLIFQGLQSQRIWLDRSLELDQDSLTQLRQALMLELGI